MSQSRNSQKTYDDELPCTQKLADCSQGSDVPEPVETVWGRLVEIPVNSNSKPLIHDLVVNEITIGRKKTCKIVINDSKVSGLHAVITRIPDSRIVQLEDKSSNGTYVGGEKVGKGKQALLVNNNRIDLVSKFGTSECVMSFMFEDLNSQPSEEQQLLKGYDLRNEIILGSGAFSTVKLALDKKTGEKRAIKIIHRYKYNHTQSASDQLEREIQILRSVKHENIISVFDVVSTKTNMYLILELAEGGELFEDIYQRGFYSEEDARVVFLQILEAVKYLHLNGIVHRDLKPENILLKKKGELKIKISDFGLARLVDDKRNMTTLCGTPQYVAPEILSQTNPINSPKGYGKEVDIWSLGAILYVMLSGLPAFSQDDSRLYEKIEQGHFSFPEEAWSDVSNQAKDLILKMMTVDPELRISVEAALEHPWSCVNNSSKSLIMAQKNLQKTMSQMKSRGDHLSQESQESPHRFSKKPKLEHFSESPNK